MKKGTGNTSTSIPVSGDRTYTRSMRTLASLRGVTVAELVRKALDAAYGAELERIRGIFFGTGDASKQQKSGETSKE